MELRDYLHFNRLTVSSFSRRLHLLSPVHLYKVVNGKRRPSRRLAHHIELITHGQVTLKELLNARYEEDEQENKDTNNFTHVDYNFHNPI